VEEDLFQRLESELSGSCKNTTPKRIIYFADGDIMEEYSPEEDKDGEQSSAHGPVSSA
jgi:hypothetical protein